MASKIIVDVLGGVSEVSFSEGSPPKDHDLLIAARALRSQFDGRVNRRLFPKLLVSGNFTIYIDDEGELRINWTTNGEDAAFRHDISDILKATLEQAVAGIIRNYRADQIAWLAMRKDKD